MNTMLKQTKPEKLDAYIKKIRSVFPELFDDSILTKAKIDSYYTESYWGYALFHSWAGSIHMALSKDGKFSKNDYFGQAEHIARKIKDIGACQSVLELGCGRGFNVGFLSKAVPSTNFIGIDLNTRHVSSAIRYFGGEPNVRFHQGSFDELNKLDIRDCGLVFAIESLCHSLNLEKTLDSIVGVLKRGGKLIVFDGFRSGIVKSSEIEKAGILVERAMAVPRFFGIEEFKKCARDRGLMLKAETDFSEEILPNLQRLGSFAKAYFKFRLIALALRLLLPRSLAQNAVAGLLMPATVTEQFHRYMYLEFEKE